MSDKAPSELESSTRKQSELQRIGPAAPFLARFSGRRQLAPTPRGETTITEAVETSDER